MTAASPPVAIARGRSYSPRCGGCGGGVVGVEERGERLFAFAAAVAAVAGHPCSRRRRTTIENPGITWPNGVSWGRGGCPNVLGERAMKGEWPRESLPTPPNATAPRWAYAYVGCRLASLSLPLFGDEDEGEDEGEGGRRGRRARRALRALRGSAQCSRTDRCVSSGIGPTSSHWS